MQTNERTVVGGGIAGLIAAIALAQKGDRVTLYEQSRTLGGRAGTERREAFALNLGPHALYCNGVLANTLRDWGVPFSGKPANFGDRACLVRGSEKFRMPIDTKTLVLTGALSLTEKTEAGLLLNKIGSAKEPVDEAMRLSAWLDQHVRSPQVRQMLEAFFRLGTYANDPEHTSARLALAQFRLGATGVLYLDGGWETMIDALAQKARSLGVQIETGRVVERGEPGMLLAVPPAQVEHLTGVRLPEFRPVRAACLDIALNALPRDAALFAIGLDRPLYFSVHSAIASLAPAGRFLVHVARYLAPSEQAAREELEDFADLLIPGWKTATVFTRYLPNMTVSHALPTPHGRPREDAIDGYAIAGDWVGNGGMLADAATASALKAAQAL